MLIVRNTITRLLVFWFWQCQLALSLSMPLPQSQQLQSQQTQQQQLNGPQNQLRPEINSTLIMGLVDAFQQAQNVTSNQVLPKDILNKLIRNNLALLSMPHSNSTNLHEPRLELRYQSKYPFVSIDERTPNNTVVAAVVVNDEDSGPNGETSLTIEHGNELGHFKLVSTQFTNTIQVNGAPLSRLRVAEYNLTIVAQDHGSPPKSSAVNLVIKLNTSLSPIGTNAPLEPQPSLKPPVTDLMYIGLMLVVIFSAFILIVIIACALVHKPKSKIGPLPRTTSNTNSRMHPSDCLCSGHTHF